MPSSSLQIPGGAIARQKANTAYAKGGGDYQQLIAERVLTYGTTLGEHVVDWAYDVVTVGAGAPGTLDVDLLALVTPDGDVIAPVVGTMVYLEVMQLTGAADMKIRKSAANAVELLSGTTDTLDIPGGHSTPLDVLKNTTTKINAGLAFDATHKQLQFESTAGGQLAILVACI
jgi:hypothetical protein